MKKVLFLAIAALAYAGSANAQALAYSTGGTYPTANAVSATSLVALVSGVATQDATNGNTSPIKMTTGGTYQFSSTSTDWATILGGTWASTISGSIIKFKASPATTDAVYAEVAALSGASTTDGESKHITSGTADAFDLTITPTSALTSFTFEEVAIKFGQTTLGAFTTSYANSVGCSSPFTVNVKTVAIPAWAGNAYTVNNTGDVVIDNPTICTSAVLAGAANITVKLAANTDITTRYIKASLSCPTATAASPVFTDKVFEGTTSANQTYDVFVEALAASGKALAGFTAGVYTFTVSEVSDDILNNADNASTIANLTDKSVVFTILPAPRPTLTTATKI